MLAAVLAYLRRHHLALIALAVALGGTSYAAIHDSAATKTVRACVKKRSGEVRIVGARAKCRRGERRVSWNQKGPAGPVGEQGPAGESGPAGQAPAPGPWHRVGGQGEPTYGAEWA
jgi:hypothetical protein